MVVKRYRSWELGEPEREWRALELLDAHAPGLAPSPVRADLEAVPPTVVMSRLDGGPLEGAVGVEPGRALAEAIVRLQEAIPRRVLLDVPPRAGHPVDLLRRVRGLCSRVRCPEDDPLSAEAITSAATWVDGSDLEDVLARPGTPVLGSGDGNLANYLWDGTRVRLVDFEYSGRSDRAYELAEVAEHISVWEQSTTGLEPVLDRVELTPDEAVRLRDCRRLLALFWLLRVLSRRDHRHGRSAAAALPGQATRLLELL
ncbi:aminoglycoside phosphotransferase family protein [Spirillospora sp. NBC_00431]